MRVFYCETNLTVGAFEGLSEQRAEPMGCQRKEPWAGATWTLTPHPEPPPLLEKIQVAAQPRTSHVTSLGSRGHICGGGACSRLRAGHGELPLCSSSWVRDR